MSLVPLAQTTSRSRTKIETRSRNGDRQKEEAISSPIRLSTPAGDHREKLLRKYRSKAAFFFKVGASGKYNHGCGIKIASYGYEFKKRDKNSNGTRSLAGTSLLRGSHAAAPRMTNEDAIDSLGYVGAASWPA